MRFGITTTDSHLSPSLRLTLAANVTSSPKQTSKAPFIHSAPPFRLSAHNPALKTAHNSKTELHSAIPLEPRLVPERRLSTSNSGDLVAQLHGAQPPLETQGQRLRSAAHAEPARESRATPATGVWKWGELSGSPGTSK